MLDFDNGYDHYGRRKTQNSMEVFRMEDGRVARHSWSGEKESYALDPQTGMPLLKEKGAYFRVETRKEAVVRYMKKRWWWSDKVLVSSARLSASRKLTEDDILWMALSTLEHRERLLEEERELVEQVERLRKEKAAVREHNDRFSGKYPPKKLEVSDVID